MSTILEANDYIPMIVDGVKNIYTTLVGEKDWLENSVKNNENRIIRSLLL